MRGWALSGGAAARGRAVGAGKRGARQAASALAWSGRLGNRGLLRLLRAARPAVASVGAARAGQRGGGDRLPHLAQLQAAFGPDHDLGRVGAHVGGAAADAGQAMGASAYTVGENISFAATPTVEEVAHEAAHVIQQRQGRAAGGDRGTSGRALEDEADRVAGGVARGERVDGLLGPAAAPATGAPSAVQRRLLATQTTTGAVARFRALAEPAAGETLLWDPSTRLVVATSTLPTPATSPSFAANLDNIMTDPAQDAEVNFGAHQSNAAGTLGVAIGLFPDPPDLTGSRVQLIDMDDIEAVESGAPGHGVAMLAHELVENYIAHGFTPTPGVSRFPTAHEVGNEATSNVAEELVGPGRLVAQAIVAHSLASSTVVQDFENYYLVFDVTAVLGSPVDTQVSGAHMATRLRLAFMDVDSYVTGSDAPPAGAAGPLASIAAVLAANPSATARIAGFTDDVGAATANQALSERRADTIKTLLVIAAGGALGPAGPSRLFALGLGATSFIASNATAAGRAMNRRVEITIDCPKP